jgi:hypothetical protein
MPSSNAVKKISLKPAKKASSHSLDLLDQAQYLITALKGVEITLEKAAESSGLYKSECESLAATTRYLLSDLRDVHIAMENERW